MDNDFIFQKDFTLVGEENLQMEMTEQNSYIKVDFKEQEVIEN